MPKFKEGDVVEVIEEDIDFRVGEMLTVLNENDEDDFIRALSLNGTIEMIDANKVKLMSKRMKNMDNLEVGDVLVNKAGHEKTVLAVLESLVGLSFRDEPVYFEDWYTTEYLTTQGYTVKGTEETTEMTVSEIADKLNIKNLKIVKE